MDILFKLILSLLITAFLLAVFFSGCWLFWKLVVLSVKYLGAFGGMFTFLTLLFLPVTYSVLNNNGGKNDKGN